MTLMVSKVSLPATTRAKIGAKFIAESEESVATDQEIAETATIQEIIKYLSQYLVKLSISQSFYWL